MGWVARSRAQRRPGATLEAFHGVRANCPPHWRSTVISRDARTASAVGSRSQLWQHDRSACQMGAGGRAPDALVELHQLARRLAGVLGEGAAGPCASARDSWCGSRRARTSTSRDVGGALRAPRELGSNHRKGRASIPQRPTRKCRLPALSDEDRLTCRAPLPPSQSCGAVGLLLSKKSGDGGVKAASSFGQEVCTKYCI